MAQSQGLQQIVQQKQQQQERAGELCVAKRLTGYETNYNSTRLHPHNWSKKGTQLLSH